MPLIVICGTPLSGKSFRAKQLADYFTSKETQSAKCVVISDEERLSSLGPNQIFQDAKQEKELRSLLKSEVQRNLSLSKLIVILDSSNYIKGYRYELYCLSKQFQTTYTLVECEPPPTVLCPFFDESGDKRHYSRQMFQEMMQRYEPPNASNRWDSPLFRVAFQDEFPCFNEIEDAVLRKAGLKANRSTQSLSLTTDNFVFELDKQTQEVIKQIQMALQLNQLRGIKVKHSSAEVNLSKKITIPELNKLRRQFINYTRIKPFDDKDRIVTAFVQFINNSV